MHTIYGPAQQQGHNTRMAAMFSLANPIPMQNQMEDTNYLLCSLH